MKRLLYIGLAATLPALTACGGGSTGPMSTPMSVPPVSSAEVDATPDIRFAPGTVTLAAGGTITFKFASVPHNVYFDNAPAGAPDNITAPTANASLTRTFTTPGRFVFNCHVHPGMTGVIVVQ